MMGALCNTAVRTTSTCVRTQLGTQCKIHFFENEPVALNFSPSLPPRPLSHRPIPAVSLFCYLSRAITISPRCLCHLGCPPRPTTNGDNKINHNNTTTNKYSTCWLAGWLAAIYPTKYYYRSSSHRRHYPTDPLETRLETCLATPLAMARPLPGLALARGWPRTLKTKSRRRRQR